MILFQTETYDPNTPDGAEPSAGSQYLSRKDAKWVALILVILGLFAIPIYHVMLDGRNEHICRQNMSQVSKALGVYAEEHDGRYPPLFVTGSNGSPAHDEKGRSYTWVSLLKDGMNTRSSFDCPAADDSEKAHSQHPSDSSLTIDSSYGMYSPYSAFAIAEIANPEQVIIVSETANHGANNTYNPLPYKTADGTEVPNDGFVIGFNDSNTDITRQASHVTRLAFGDTAKGDFTLQKAGRHSKGVWALTASGEAMMISPPTAALDLLIPGRPQGRWAVPLGKLR